MIWNWRQKLQAQSCNLIFRIVQYWTAIYPGLADHFQWLMKGGGKYVEHG
jgi:hypothetical protein